MKQQSKITQSTSVDLPLLLTDLPDDILFKEIFPKLNVDNLKNLIKSKNKRLSKLASEFIKEEMDKIENITIEHIEKILDNRLPNRERHRLPITDLVLATLVKKGALKEGSSKEGSSKNVSPDKIRELLYKAIIFEREELPEFIKQLLKNVNKINLNTAYINDVTFLKIAVNMGRIKTVKLLLDNNADPNIENEEGYTPLHDAAFNGYKDIVELLLKYNADRNAINIFEEKPMDLAKTDEIYSLLFVEEGGATHAMYKGRKYKVRTGQKGGRYIMVGTDKKKMYLK